MQIQASRQIYRKAVSRRFGRYLVVARQQAGISQQALADLASIHRDDVSRFERGLVCPRLDTVLRLSASLGDDPVKFLQAVGAAVQADG